MNSPILDRFPHAVRINGFVYELNTDFRVGLKIMEAFEDHNLTNFEKQVVMCGLLFRHMPDDFSAASAAARKFLDCGKEPKEPSGGRVYSWVQDAEYIYSAFYQSHGIDLQTAQMHWWQFCLLFGDLREDTVFSRIVSLRRRKERGKLSKEEKSLFYELPDVLYIKEHDPERDAAEQRFRQLMGGG